MTKMRRDPLVLPLLAGCAMVLMATATVAQNPVETFPHVATAGVEPLESLRHQQALQNWLISEMPSGVLDDPVQVRVTRQDLDEVDRRDREDPGRTVVGLTAKVGQRLELSELMAIQRPGQSLAGGILRSTDDGGFVWAVALTSEGASALRVGFGNVRLPGSAELYVHNLRGQAFGPYTGRHLDASGGLWSHTVMGSMVIVQLRHHGPAMPSDLRSTGVGIDKIGHIGPRFRPAAVTRGEAFCPYNEPCIENAQCFNSGDWGGLEDAQKGVALMLWISGAFINTCTGGLLADTDDSTEIPYFLTANHCLSKNNNAASLETYFQFEVGCGGGCPSQWAGGGIQVLGATVKASNRTGDYTLLELQATPPAGSVFMGWTTVPVADAEGTNLFRVSHPSTAPQAFSTHTVDTSAPTCRNIPRGDWIYSRDVVGASEGGSSGSPVCNAAGQVVGQLTGACGFNIGDECDSISNATIDGAFASYFSDIEQFLDPDTPCTPSTELCDGLDNDCDGDVDEGFPPPEGTVLLTVQADLLSWTVDTTATGYDVVRGDLDLLKANAGDFSVATMECLANDHPATSLTDPDLPLQGAGWWTLVRSVNCTTNGSYGSIERDNGVESSSFACP